MIAKRLLESKQNIPHLYLSSGFNSLMPFILVRTNLCVHWLAYIIFHWYVSDVILDPLLSLRKDLKGMDN